METELAAGDGFRVRWNAVAPRAEVERIEQGGQSHSVASVAKPGRGLGYVEHLRLESAHLKLPFRQLRWGRAHAGEFSLVWIHWSRGRDLSLLVENGARAEGRIETLADGAVKVQTQFGQWATEHGRVLCDREVRRAFPRWLVMLTGGMAPVQELKVAGRVRLTSGGKETEGTGIWEEVSWL